METRNEETESPVTQIYTAAVKRKPKKTVDTSVTILKILSPTHEFIDVIAVFLSTGFAVEPTSKKMFSEDTNRFFQFFRLEPKNREASL